MEYENNGYVAGEGNPFSFPRPELTSFWGQPYIFRNETAEIGIGLDGEHQPYRFLCGPGNGILSEQGIVLEITTPANDNYQKTPAKKVELGEAHIALCPFESILSYNTKKQPFDAVALATIFREDVSAIVSLEGSGIQSPKDLDGKVYASYKARYEDKIVKQMVRNDGGAGNLKITYPEKLGIWETLLKGQCDATWIFLNWEGVHARTKGVQLNTFTMKDYGIPYGYSPVLMASKRLAKENMDGYRRFFKSDQKRFFMGYGKPTAWSELYCAARCLVRFGYRFVKKSGVFQRLLW